MVERPPKWADRFLSFICSDKYIDELQGDLHEMYFRNLELVGRRKACLRFVLEVLLAFRFYRLKDSKSSYYSPNRMDIFMLNLKLSYRQLIGSKLYTFINILGLTIGFVAFISIFFWRQSEMNTDRWHENVENIYLLTVQTDSTVDHVRARYGGIAEKVGEKYPEVKAYTEISDVEVYLENEEREVQTKADAIVVHPGFFEIFDFELIDCIGDALMSEPQTIILTESLSRTLFGDKNPIGAFVIVEYTLAEPYKVVGLIKDVPDHSSFSFDCIVPEHKDGNYWGRMSFGFVELFSGNDPGAFGEKIKADSRDIYSNTRTKTLVKPFPLADIYFNSDFEWFAHGNYAQTEILGLVALLIILVSIINYANLATAQARNRAKEIGIKKINGASRSSVFVQFYLESAFMVLTSFGLAVIAVQLGKGQIFLLVGKSFDISYFETQFLISFALGLFIVFLLAGIYPASHLSSFQPMRSMKGNINPKKSVFRYSSVILQYSVCIILLIGTFVLHNQLNFLQTKDLGFERESVVRFEFFNEELRVKDKNDREILYSKLTRVYDELNKSSLVEAAGSSSFPLFDGTMDCWGFDEDPDRKVPLAIGGADDQFSKLYDIPLIEGRFFGDPHPTDSTIKSSRSGVIINRTASETLFSADAIGKRFTTSSWGEREVIGVLEDFNYQHLSMPIKPMFLYRSSRETTPVVRFARGKLREGMEFVQKLHNELDTGVPFSYEFLDEELGAIYEKDRAITKLMSALSIIALVIASLGLFALSAYVVELRVKEIGIRKVNGANVLNIFSLLSRDFLKWVAYAMVIAMPLGWFFMNYWLQNYAYRIEISWWIFALSGGVILLVSWITVSYHTSKASLTNPIDVLRSE